VRAARAREEADRGRRRVEVYALNAVLARVAEADFQRLKSSSHPLAASSSLAEDGKHSTLAASTTAAV
jgi:hypothetical protein